MIKLSNDNEYVVTYPSHVEQAIGSAYVMYTIVHNKRKWIKNVDVVAYYSGNGKYYGEAGSLYNNPSSTFGAVYLMNSMNSIDLYVYRTIGITAGQSLPLTVYLHY